MLEIFNYEFMLRAFLAGLLVALVIPVLGTFMVARQYSLIAESLAHVSLAGVGAGLLLGTAPVVLAVPVTVAGALLLEWLRQSRRISGETSLAIVMSAGLALAVVLATLSPNRTDFTSYLFGSIVTTSWSDVLMLLAAAAVILGLLGYKYHAFLHIAFDEDSARVAGHRVALLNYALVILAAVMVVLSLRIVGGLLISALLVIPVVAAGQVSKSFAQTMVVAVLLALVAVVAGLVVSFYTGIAAGGAIVLAALALLLIIMLAKVK
jgi:zinc transport system permease protein